MSWHLYEVTFKIKSPLHIGHLKILHYQKTRYYVPGRQIWAALTVKCAQHFAIMDYKKIGEFLKNSLRISYFYLSDDNQVYCPKFTGEGVKYGDLSTYEFEKRFISSFASTAIDPNLLSAEEEMLHEIDYISPYGIVNGEQNFLKGLIWCKENQEKGFEISANDNEFVINHSGIERRLSELAKEIQVGGERRIGFGLISILDCKKIDNEELSIFRSRWQENTGNIEITLNKDCHIFCHALNNHALQIKGDVELLIFRDWHEEKGSGKNPVLKGHCWIPGSVLLNETKFRLNEDGILEL